MAAATPTGAQGRSRSNPRGNTCRIVLSQNGLPVRGLQVAEGHLWIVSSTLGSQPASFWRNAVDAIRWCLMCVSTGGGPRLPSECFPGNQAGSASTLRKDSETEPCAGASSVYASPVASVLRSVDAIQDTCTWPPCMSLLASRNPRASACCHGVKRPGADVCQSLRRSAWEMTMARAVSPRAHRGLRAAIP